MEGSSARESLSPFETTLECFHLYELSCVKSLSHSHDYHVNVQTHQRQASILSLLIGITGSLPILSRPHSHLFTGGGGCLRQAEIRDPRSKRDATGTERTGDSGAMSL